MTSLLRDILLFSLGMIMCVPWVLLCVHLQNVFYGFSQRSKLSPVGWMSSIVTVCSLGSCAYGAWLSLSALQHAMVLGGWPTQYTLPTVERLWFALGAILVCAVVIWKFKQRRFLTTLANDPPGCPDCGYDLRGSPIASGSVRCPECGHVQSVGEIINRARARKRQREVVESQPWVE